ncbi:MAG: IS1182 family transposase [bacterium]
MRLPLDLSMMIEPTDSVITFIEVLGGMDLSKYFVSKPSVGRLGYNAMTLMKIVLFAMMENKRSLREMEKACRTDIRFMWLAGEAKPTHATFQHFINGCLKDNIETILRDVTMMIAKKTKIDLKTSYLDGTKIEANANKYKWVWKKASEKHRAKLNATIGKEYAKMNDEGLQYERKGFVIKARYEAEDVLAVMSWLVGEMERQELRSVYGKGTRKSEIQRHLDHFDGYLDALMRYEDEIRICGPDRNSYAKTDHGATFMRMKEDYMKNGQLKPGYNLQLAVSDGYITAAGTFQERDDQGTFATMADRLNRLYGFYPTNIVADAGYGSIENYLVCQERKMRPFVKYAMYSKEKERKYQKDPYRVANMRQEDGSYVCPQGHPFEFTGTRTRKTTSIEYRVDLYECGHCESCPVKAKCTKAKENRRIEICELGIKFYAEAKVLLDSEEGIRLRINRSIQSEGAFATIKQDSGYRRLSRRGLENANLEFHLVAIGHNLFKYHQERLKATA